MVLWFVVLFVAVATLAWGARVKIGVVKTPLIFCLQKSQVLGCFLAQFGDDRKL
jgi:hypothetical protein